MNVALNLAELGQDLAPLDILMVSARFPPLAGGTEMHVYETSRRMAALGHRVTVLTTDRSGQLPEAEEREGVAIIRRPAWPRDRDYYLAPALWREITTRRWDVLHLQGYHTFVAPLAMAAAIRMRRPFVLTFHSGGHSSDARNRLRGLQVGLLRPLARRAARLIGVSQFEAEHFSRLLGVPRSAFAVVGNGAELPPASDRRRDSAAPLIISVGRLEKYKGHHRVIAAFPYLREKYPAARLRIVGEGPCEAMLRAQVARLGLEDCVTIGAIPAGQRGTMADLFAEASLMALLSDYEAHPVAVMEAVSLGTPVLTGDGSGFAELAERGTVRAVPPESDPLAVAAAMIAAIEAPPARFDLHLPNWSDCTRQLLAIYADVLAGRPAK